jgi:NADH dehydrogenase (ubiquinone) 1 alpha subcomplex subunit 9
LNQELTTCRTLSSSALDALKQFYAERDAHTEKFAKLQAAAQEKERLAAEEQAQILSMELFTEDWGKSQFWVGVSSQHLSMVLGDGRWKGSG